MRILKGVGSKLLPCGCLIGRYETYAGITIDIIDARGAGCPDAGHRVGDPPDRPRDGRVVEGNAPQYAHARHAGVWKDRLSGRA
jgi:hypothetical protein